ncbi:MAG: LCP family protein [Acidimicrobiales bacterium]
MSLLRPDHDDSRADAPGGSARKHPLRHRLAVGFTVFLTAAVALVGAGVVYTAIQTQRVQTVKIPENNSEGVITRVPKGQPVNILVVGSDSRTFAKGAEEKKEFGSKDVGDSLRSDTMMVMRLDPKNDRVTILSIARDLYVDLEGGGRGRINEAFAKKGDPAKADPGRLIRTITSNFGITINHYVEIDFAGFREAVDAIGGVSVYFPFPARDAFSLLDIDQKGCVKLNGKQALSYVRSRHYEFKGPKGWQSEGSGDIGRIQRQQDFIKRVVRKSVAEGLTNPIKAARLIEAGIDNVKVDTGFSMGDMKSLASQLRDLDDGKVAPVALTGDPVVIDGQDVLKVNPARASEVLAAFGATLPTPVTSSTTRRGAGATSSSTSTTSGGLLTTSTTRPPAGSDPSVAC